VALGTASTSFEFDLQEPPSFTARSGEDRRQGRARDGFVYKRELHQGDAAARNHRSACGIGALTPGVPLGYHEAMGERLDLPRDIDVLFLGALAGRQKSAIAFLRRNGINVEARGSWSGRDTWGSSRTELINRAKILLNLQRFPGQFSGYRLVLGMGNGAMVISEPMYDSSPFVAGKHFVSVDLEKMPAAIRSYLKDDSAREQFARDGHRFVTQDLRMEDSIRKVVALMQDAMPEKRAS
jgi:hypothetical protein